MVKHEKNLWDDACQHLRDRLSEDVFDKWISIIHFQSVEKDQIVLTVGNSFYKDWITNHFLSLITDALAIVSGESLQIEFKIDSNLEAESSNTEDLFEHASKSKKSKSKPKKKISNLNKHYTFDSFVVGPSNQFAHAAAMASAQSPSRAYNPLFIYGGVGLGKTHLMQAIGHFIDSKKLKGNVCYTTTEAFVNEYIEAIRNNSLPKFRKKYRTVDALLIDDIHFLAGKDRMQEEFFHTFNAIFENHKQIVMTSDRPAGEVSGLTPRLVSRFEWGLVVELEAPEVETRVAILKKKCDQLNLTIDQDLLFFIAERVSSNIRRLEGALIRVASYVSLTGQKMDQAKLEHLLRDALDQEKRHSISIECIQREVAEHFDLRVGDILGRKRPNNIAWPRQVAMYLSRDMTEQSFPVIGQAFGRNHATIVHACQTVEKRQTEDLSLRQTLSLLRQRVGKKAQQTANVL